MHKYTLRFENPALEMAYGQYLNKSKIRHMAAICKLNIPMALLVSIISFLREDYIPFAISLAFFLNNLGLLRMVNLFEERKAIMLYETLVFVAPIGVLILIYFSNNRRELGINLVVYIMIQVQIIVTTQNIFLASFQLLINYVVVIMIVYIAFGYQIYTSIWLPTSLFSLYNYYNRKWNQRLLFQQSQVNQSIFTLIKETVNDDIMCFKLNKELLEYQLEFTNIQNFDLSTFLSSIVVDRKINGNNLASDKHKIIGYQNQKERVELEIYIQYYPELKFYIRTIKKSHPLHAYPEEESKIMHKFYLKMLWKAQQKPYLINLQYMVQMLCSLSSRIKLERIKQNPFQLQYQFKKFNLFRVISQCCQNLNIQLNLKDNSAVNFIVNSHKITFEILIFYLLRLLKIKNSKVQLYVCRDARMVSVLFNFSNDIKIQQIDINRYLINIQMLQGLLSSKPVLIETSSLSCYIDIPEGIPFRR